MPKALKTAPPAPRRRGRLRTCPQCGSKEVAPIVYGYPADMDAYLKASREGLIVGGGCVIGPDDPAWSCRACHHTWGRRDG